MPRFKVANKLFTVKFGKFSAHDFIISRGRVRQSGILRCINHSSYQDKLCANFCLTPTQAKQVKDKIVDEALKLNKRRKKK